MTSLEGAALAGGGGLLGGLAVPAGRALGAGDLVDLSESWAQQRSTDVRSRLLELLPSAFTT